MLAVLGLGPGEVLALLALALVLFGAKRLPEIGRSLGQGMREFKRSVRDITEDEPPTSPQPPKSEHGSED